VVWERVDAVSVDWQNDEVVLSLRFLGDWETEDLV
jgi:hypothetical protein